MSRGPRVPAPPITEAMREGREPLRTFGDLFQFVKQSDEPEPAPAKKRRKRRNKKKQPAEGAEAAALAEGATVAEAVPGAPESTDSSAGASLGAEVAGSAGEPAIGEPASTAPRQQEPPAEPESQAHADPAVHADPAEEQQSPEHRHVPGQPRSGGGEPADATGGSESASEPASAGPDEAPGQSPE